MNSDFYKNLPHFEWVEDPENPNFYLYRHDFKIYYASDIPDEWLAKVVEIVETHEGHGFSPPKPVVAYLARPDNESLQGKWIVAVIREGDFSRLGTEPLYILGLLHGLLLSGLYLKGK